MTALGIKYYISFPMLTKLSVFLKHCLEVQRDHDGVLTHYHCRGNLSASLSTDSNPHTLPLLQYLLPYSVGQDEGN